ncbi:MAG: hypothetical protein IPM14_16695 [bacterium]|nr:hypothetical protein [bacterium]
MRTTLLISSLLIYLFYDFSGFAQDCKADAIISTNLENAELFLNDSLKQIGNDFHLELEPGSHIITLCSNCREWNSELIIDTLEITNCSSISFTYNFKSRVFVDSNPQNVYVIQSDSIIGFTPLWLDDNFQSLNLKKPDYSEVTLTHNELVSGIKPELQFIGENKSESFYESALFKILTGTLIALGATTAYYKLEADKTFDEYQITGDPALQEQTEKYDLISGVTFVALQINFGFILYFFLAD